MHWPTHTWTYIRVCLLHEISRVKHLNSCVLAQSAAWLSEDRTLCNKRQQKPTTPFVAHKYTHPSIESDILKTAWIAVNTINEWQLLQILTRHEIVDGKSFCVAVAIAAACSYIAYVAKLENFCWQAFNLFTIHKCHWHKILFRFTNHALLLRLLCLLIVFVVVFFWFKHLSVLLLLLLQYMKSIEKYITKNRLQQQHQRQHIHTKQLSEFCNLSQSNCRFVDSSSVLTVAIIGKTLTMCPQFMCVTKFFRYLFVFGMRLTLKRVANLLNLRYWPNIIVGCC